jgi:hypothetical protein
MIWRLSTTGTFFCHQIGQFAKICTIEIEQKHRLYKLTFAEKCRKLVRNTGPPKLTLDGFLGAHQV